MSTIDLVTAVINGDKEAAEAAFNASVAGKVSDALEVKKVEIATNLVTSEEETDETTNTETEDSGAESVDDSSAVTSETE